MKNVVWVNFKNDGEVKNSENVVSVKNTGVGEYEIKAVHVDFKTLREQKETMDKIKAENFNATTRSPLEAIEKMISGLKPKEKETQNE
tara:strand:- start:815 stop:1078 length:264 start_codon:yes stop_codon:yes gene_type:complete